MTTTLSPHLLRRALLLLASLGLLAAAPACGGDDKKDPTTCTAGTAGCECAAGGECGTGLVCGADNMCSAPACTAGTTGCECTASGTCSDASDECGSDNMCGPKTTCTGELGCACDGTTCDEGLTCNGGLCTQANALFVTLSGGDARACDLRIKTTGRKVKDVSFPAGFRGKMRTRDLDTAIAVIRTTDTAMDGVAVGLVFDGDDAVADGEATLESATCYDRLGAATTAVSATLD
ncbi:MAG: hypothetical protein KC635_05910 [Myxococcales bacterium]|nr:hypothetical protein [Myxococcales bacterium]MCB9735174.1 hypothetical protein [Deltaproteobacteria bacterium]